MAATKYAMFIEDASNETREPRQHVSRQGNREKNKTKEIRWCSKGSQTSNNDFKVSFFEQDLEQSFYCFIAFVPSTKSLSFQVFGATQVSIKLAVYSATESNSPQLYNLNQKINTPTTTPECATTLPTFQAPPFTLSSAMALDLCAETATELLNGTLTTMHGTALTAVSS